MKNKLHLGSMERTILLYLIRKDDFVNTGHVRMDLGIRLDYAKDTLKLLCGKGLACSEESKNSRYKYCYKALVTLEEAARQTDIYADLDVEQAVALAYHREENKAVALEKRIALYQQFSRMAP